MFGSFDSMGGKKDSNNADGAYSEQGDFSSGEKKKHDGETWICIFGE